MFDSQVMWEIFSSTGSINAYLLYKKLISHEIEHTPMGISIK